MDTTAAKRRRIPYDVLDIAEQLDGATRADLVPPLSATIDRVYFLRTHAAYAATLIERALEFKGFSANRRPYGVAQVGFLSRMARGDASAVKFDRQSHYVERAAKASGIRTWLRETVPAGIDTSGSKGAELDLRYGIGFALQELLDLRQLASYEAGVARVHDIPSGPKGVRRLLEQADQALTLAIDADFDSLPAELRAIDRRAALRAVGVEPALTNEAFLSAHGLTMADRA